VARAALALLPILLALAFWAVHPSIAIDADSPRYLTGSAMRTATYPIFLDIVTGRALLPVQLLFFGFALSSFALSVGRHLSFPLTALLTLGIAPSMPRPGARSPFSSPGFSPGLRSPSAPHCCRLPPGSPRRCGSDRAGSGDSGSPR
jgi:hypothetical protein